MHHMQDQLPPVNQEGDRDEGILTAFYWQTGNCSPLTLSPDSELLLAS